MHCHHFHYSSFVLLTTYLHFTTAKLSALNIIGGYPTFIKEIYVQDQWDTQVENHPIRSNAVRFPSLSTIPRFVYRDADCPDFTFNKSGCKTQCSWNDPNCTTEQLIDREKLLKGESVFVEEIPGGYVYGDEVRTNGQLSVPRPAANGFCTQSFKQPIKFKVNYTASCAWHFHVDKGCNVSDLVSFLSNLITGTDVCDKAGKHCAVPILRELATRSVDQKCDNYTKMSVRLATQQGSILGMLIKFQPSSGKCREDYCILTTKVSFQEITLHFLNRMKMSKYENSEGRFRCPSEVTCFSEVLYFLDTFDPEASSTQFLMLIPLLLLFLLYFSVNDVGFMINVCFM